MNDFKINFRLQKLQKIKPFGKKPDCSLSWFGLTDGLLWIDAGMQTIYEYNRNMLKYFGAFQKYNNYYLARFLEDLFNTFKFVSESVPLELYNSIEQFNDKTSDWLYCYDNEPDEIYESFCNGEFNDLTGWYCKRVIDSGHLTGGPDIGCFRCGDRIKIIWKSDFKLDNGKSIWTAPSGSFEMPYNDFVSGVKDFFQAFSCEMDKQVENAVKKKWRNIFVNKQNLIKENVERKSGFLKNISSLECVENVTDWNKIITLYSKMNSEILKK